MNLQQAQKYRPARNMDCLPREIILDILSRLPITCFLQCKLVCQAWNDLAKDPLLVAMYFSRTVENDPYLILHCDHPIRNQLYSLDLSSHTKDNQRVNKICVPMLPEFDVVGSCKGLLCLCDSLTRSSLYIYNPFTRDYIELPKSTEIPNHYVVFGFGFHPISKEYKVVKIVCDRSPNVLRFHYRNGPIPRQSEVQIFTLGSPDWKSLGKIPYHLFNRSGHVLVHGRLHWGTWRQTHGPRRLIISFDLSEEQFRVVPKANRGGLGRSHFSLMVIRGCLSAAVFPNCWQVEIWVMKNYDVEESWSKEFSIGLHVGRRLEQDVPESFRRSKFYSNRLFVRVLCLLENGDILLEYRCRTLVSYDPRKGTFKDLSFHGMPNWFEAVVHEGTLTPINT